MEVLKLKGITHNGKLTVAVPDAFNNKEVEVIVPLLNSGRERFLCCTNS